MVAWLLSAVAPIPLVLLARTFASLYVIPSESMVPTLQKGLRGKGRLVFAEQSYGQS